jgi:hypothetical protein
MFYILGTETDGIVLKKFHWRSEPIQLKVILSDFLLVGLGYLIKM